MQSSRYTHSWSLSVLIIAIQANHLAHRSTALSLGINSVVYPESYDSRPPYNENGDSRTVVSDTPGGFGRRRTQDAYGPGSERQLDSRSSGFLEHVSGKGPMNKSTMPLLTPMNRTGAILKQEERKNGLVVPSKPVDEAEDNYRGTNYDIMKLLEEYQEFQRIFNISGVDLGDILEAEGNNYHVDEYGNLVYTDADGNSRLSNIGEAIGGTGGIVFDVATTVLSSVLSFFFPVLTIPLFLATTGADLIAGAVAKGQTTTTTTTVAPALVAPRRILLPAPRGSSPYVRIVFAD